MLIWAQHVEIGIHVASFTSHHGYDADENLKQKWRTCIGLHSKPAENKDDLIDQSLPR